IYRGGTAVTSQFPPSRQLRATFSGTNVAMKAELYDRTDLLEPIVRINFEDDVNPTAHSAGENLIGFLNVDINAYCDFTFDNYHSTALRTTPVAFPGVAQVVNLTPAAQSLFYQPRANSNITFNVTTFTTNQVATN